MGLIITFYIPRKTVEDKEKFRVGIQDYLKKVDENIVVYTIKED